MPSALLILSSASACITASPPSIPIDSTNLTNINSTKSGIYLTCVLFIRKARRTPECRYAKSFLLCKNHELTSLFRFTNSTSPHRRPPRNPVTQMLKFRAHKNQNTFCTMYIPRRKRLYESTLRRFKQYDKRAERIRFVAAPDGLFRACFGHALAGASGLRPPMECAQVNRPCKHTPFSSPGGASRSVMGMTMDGKAAHQKRIRCFAQVPLIYGGQSLLAADILRM